MHTERTNAGPVIVAAAIVRAGRLLACCRARPPQLAGYWELPGGKVEPGEPEPAALARECLEELAVQVTVADRVGPDLPIGRTRAVLRVYWATLAGDAAPRPLEHAELRWLAADELASVPWLPADQPLLPALRPRLATAASADTEAAAAPPGT